MYTRTINQTKDKLMTTLTANETYTATATDLYRDLIVRATLGQVEQASVWYHEAQEVAHEVARNLDTTLEVGASVVSAFSPRERWASNIEKAVAFSLGHTPKGLGNNLKMAQASLTAGFYALKGLKTNAFARAIAGDSDAVVIDVWMMRAANMETDSPSQGQYFALSLACRNVAKEFGLTPRTAQALIWIVVRGSAI
jgi:hypothetical protein